MRAKKCSTQSTEYNLLISFGNSQVAQFSPMFTPIHGMILAEY
jgi:hypothetical protein